MTTTMIQPIILRILMHVFLVSCGVWCLEPVDGDSLLPDALDLPWQDALCCDSHVTRVNAEGGDMHSTETNHTESNLPLHPRCSFRSMTTDSHLHEPSMSPLDTGICLDILCRVDENWEKLICDVKSQHQTPTTVDASLMAISLQRLMPQKEDSQMNSENVVHDNPVFCEADESVVCSIALDTSTSFVTVVTVSISSDVAPPVHLSVPARPGKPSPPVNMSHIQTIEAELILLWDNPADSDTGPLKYEVRYSFNNTYPAWQVVSGRGEPRMSLDLKPSLNYTIQVRCSDLDELPLWSDWSESHHIYLDAVSYIPEKVVARPGENVTIYCVFNDHSINASMAMWMLNFEQPLNRSLYHPVNQWVSQITVCPSETRMYDLLQCTQGWDLPYSQIFVEGASVGITCETSGDLDAMDCSWTSTVWTRPTVRSRLAYLPCDVMKERERAGENVGEMGPTCLQNRPRQKTCTIHPLGSSCYKLWLEVPSPLGPITSKPIYLLPRDHVKPHRPTNVKAVSQSSGVLMVTWKPPSLLNVGLQCQFRYQSPSTVRGQPEWKVQPPVQVPRAEVVVPDMCRMYLVQVRCKLISGLGSWSEWSDSVLSTPQNSRAPERGPDFWRILQHDSNRNMTNVTLLFKDLPVLGRSYCVDGFVVQHQAAGGAVISERIEPLSTYSFAWNQERQTVTVEAYNSLGRSTNNINMTLERQRKRGCVRSFRVTVINSTCVSVSWSLLDNSSVPLFMVVQWLPQKQHESDHHRAPSRDTWVRLPYTDRSVYLKGDFFGSEEFGFYLYPVFAEGEGEPLYTIATRGDPASYMMLMIISFLSVVLFVTLILTQNQMKRFVWKDVPNPNKCSWANGRDFTQADFEHLFRPPDGLPAWPLLLPSETISTVVIVDQADLSALTTALVQTPLVSLTPDPPAPSSITVPQGFDPEVDRTTQTELLAGGVPYIALNLDALTISYPSTDELQPVSSQTDHPPGSTDSSAQSSVTYATVLLSDPKQDQPPIHLHYKGGISSSSSDEGNFSANNSDISGSFPGGLWELDSCRGGETDDPRRSCSYNSVEELSETSEQEDEGEVSDKKDLYYLGMDYPAEDESEEEEEQGGEKTETEIRRNVVLNRDDCSGESCPLLSPVDMNTEPQSCGFSPLYLPQFRTAPCARQLQGSKPQL